MAMGDGVITKDEARAHFAERKQQYRRKRFSAIDSNSDGALSREEMSARMHHRFETKDKDRDGRISESEWLAPRSH